MPDGTPILSDAQKTQWNSFQDHLGGDYPTPTALKSFNDANPKSTLTDAHIPVALNDVAAIKANPDVPGMTPAYKGGDNPRYPVTSSGGHVAVGGNPSSIPKPDYNDPRSRLKYAQQFTKKHGPLMEGRGDTPLRVDETMDEATDSARNIHVKAAKAVGLDPTLLYASNMEEGMSGLFADKKGESDFSGNKDYPTPGFKSFGIDYFRSKVPDLIKKGYLPSGFQNQYTPHDQINEQGKKVDSADFKSPDAAVQASAALVKDFQDQAEAFAKKNNINLTPRQKEFFALAGYNGGGNMQKMMLEYNKKGALKDDSFIANPNTGSYPTIHTNIGRRILMRDALLEEGIKLD